MKKLKKDLIPLSFMLSIMVLIVFYKFLNNGDGNINSLVTNIDKTIPFLKIFILPYIMWYGYIFIGLIYLCMKNRKTYYTSLISLNIGIVACYITYAIFQTTVTRPILTNSDILSKLVNMIYMNDNPFNCFPSMHVTTTYIIMKGINDTQNSIITSFLFNIIGILIIISTQFVKQHVILDLIFAMLLSEIIFRFVNNAKKESITAMKGKIASIWIIKSKLKNLS
ncbi:phosphatase PAP2 family protein [Clostridium sp.]|uniref:phosphatase PAP2 family protein n=1 Tax=Clostridium sp. TaxID=1506 RepID=UPI001A3AB6CD|nr:phosphatase PAP2 family protein [Clostridium sp.]MBK5237399.1 phosphatase PAP2 family protein [Clostridium sp.]